MRVLAIHSIRQFPLHFPSPASPCTTRFRTSSTIDTFVNFKPGWFKIPITLSSKPLAYVVSISGTLTAISFVILES